MAVARVAVAVAVVRRVMGAGQGFFRIITNQSGGGWDPSPKSPSPPPQAKVTIVGKNEIYNRENLVRPFLVHQVLGPKPPPPPPPPPPAQKKPWGRGPRSNHQEASRKEQRIPRSLWDVLATIAKDRGRPVLCQRATKTLQDASDKVGRRPGCPPRPKMQPGPCPTPECRCCVARAPKPDQSAQST